METKRTKSLETTLAISGGLLIFYIVFKVLWLLYCAVGIILIGLFLKSLMQLISDGWMKFSEILGAVMSKVILSVVFFLVLTPIALIQRVIGKQTLVLKKPKTTGLYFDRGNHLYTSDDLKNPW